MKLNGTLLSKDREIAKIANGHIVPVNEALLPLYLQRRDDFEGWLSERAINGDRANASLLKRALGLSENTNPELVLSVNACTITDTYWFRPHNSSLSYADVRFRQNPYAMLALAGEYSAMEPGRPPTPELTNIGRFEKAWRLIDGRWWMYKAGTPLELLAELFICQLGKALGYPMAEYELSGSYVRSPDFTEGAKVNYESIWGLVGSDEDFNKSYTALSAHSRKAAENYIAMLVLDTICLNIDRHTRNYGVLRDVAAGEVIDLAPNYDNNIALVSAGYGRARPDENDTAIRRLVKFLKDAPMAMQTYNEKWRRNISPQLVETCLDKVPIEADRQFITDFVCYRAVFIEHALPLT